jgi:hypothetical protein
VLDAAAVGHPGAPGAPTFATLAAFVAAAGGAITPRNRRLWQQTFDVWQALGTERRSRVRETAFGLMITYPHGGPYVPEVFGAAPGSEAAWLRQSVKSRGSSRMPFFPDHRLPPLLGGTPIDPELAHRPMLDALVAKLRMPGGPTNFGARWLPGGDSEGMVVFLCRCDLYGGISRAGCITMSIGNQPVVGVSNSSIHTTPTPQQHLLDVNAGVTSGYQARPILEMTDVLAHELGHSEGMGALNDEYPGQAFVPLPAAAMQKVDSKPNSEQLANVQTPTGVDSDLLKWRWPRAEAGAVVEDCYVTGTDVSFVVNLSHALRWKKLAGPQSVWVRNGPLWQVNAPVGPITVNPLRLELVSFDAQTQIVRCRPLAGATAADVVDSFWTQLSVGGAVPDVRIVLQRRDASNNELWLISPAVRTELAANGPLMVNACTPSGAADRTANVAGLLHSTPAAYEGGSNLTCLVLRPARACKLSRRMEPAVILGVEMPWLRAEAFCAVCEYVMTYQLDVSLLPDVDRLL